MGEQASAGDAGRAAGDARLDAGRWVAVISLSGLAIYSVTLALAGGRLGIVEPWPLGAAASIDSAVRLSSLALALALGWAVPGLSVAMLGGDRADVPRSFIVGTAYLAATTLLWAVFAGGAPTRAPLVALLALPSLVLLARGSSVRPPWREWLGASIAVVVLTFALWPKLAHEGLNGDGTEAYELARSLGQNRLPRWDLERWAPPGRFGTPAVNPFLTNSLMVRSAMTLAGQSELSARALLVPVFVVAIIAVAGTTRSRELSAWIYVAAVGLLYLLWNSYYVGYEPAFSDLAEPAATDTLTVALLASGALELARGRLGLSIAAFVLAAGILYSAPVLVGAALLFIAATDRKLGSRPLLTWAGALGCLLLLGLIAGFQTGDLGDWLRQIRAEYVDDFVGRGTRQPGLPLLGLALLATGGLPLVVVTRRRSVPVVPAAFFFAATVYLLIVLASAEKNLHYLAPVAFLMAPAAIAVSRRRERIAASLVIAVAFLLSWPNDLSVHRETVELGRDSCVLGLDYETAVLGADVIYEALGRPGRHGHFAVGKHTFVRYALELKGDDCRLVLSDGAPPGTSIVARGRLTLASADHTVLDRWRSLRPPIPRSSLFPRADAVAE